MARFSSEYAANATLALSIVPIAVGLNALARPLSGLALLQFPPPNDYEGRRLACSLARMYGARNLSLGLTAAALWWTGDRLALGCALLAGLPVALADGFVGRWQTGGGEWSHWVFSILSVGLAAGLLEWV